MKKKGKARRKLSKRRKKPKTLKVVKEKKEKPVPSRKWVYVAVAIVALLIPASVFLYLNLNQPSEVKAAIIDQLSLKEFHPNETFRNVAIQILKEKFGKVDYYPKATVELYEKLPSLGYKLIVWRTHSALGTKNGKPQTWIAIATSEKYSEEKYRYEIEKGQITKCNLSQVGGGNLYYFGITPKFITERMQGRFNDTVIILLSCNGLAYIEPEPEHAKAFVSRGAKGVVSWDYWVNPVHNDNAGILLLRLLIEENKTVAEAVEEVPSDTSQEKRSCKMRYYPETETFGNYRIPNYKRRKTALNQNLSITQAPTSKKEKLCLKKFLQFFESTAYRIV